MFQRKPEKIIYAYGIHQSAFEDLEDAHPNLVLHQGLPTEAYFREECDPTHHSVLVLDDLIEDVAASKDMCNLFIRGVHHRNITTILLYQNLFLQSKYMRTISLNISYYVFLKSYRDQGQIKHLAQQMFGGSSRRMIEAYHDAVLQRVHGYLVVSNVPTGDEEDRLLTDIFPDDDLICYLPK